MYIGKLIDDIIRPKTGNTDVTVDTTTGVTVEGISTDLILGFINDALQFVQSRIIAVYPSEFTEEDVQNTVVDQEEYSIDDNVFLNNKFISIEYSPNGALERYFPLPPAGLHQRDTRSGKPYQYIRRNGKILLNPIPKDGIGKIRVNYYRHIDSLDIRRGKLTASSSTSITLANDSDLDNFGLADAQYICTVSKLGVVKDYNIPVTSYNSGTRVISFASQTVTATANDYVVIGKYKSTHLPEDKPVRILDYCKMYAQARILNTDSSLDEMNEKQEAKDILTDIVDQFSEMTEDIHDVAVVDDLLSH